MIRINKLILNGIEYSFTDDNQPEGINEATLSFKRDQLYIGHNLEIDTEFTFYCDSYKELLDEAYNQRGIDNEAEFHIDYICTGLNPLPFIFIVDWKTYKFDTKSTTFKLIANSEFTDYLNTDENEIELDNLDLQEVFVRKIPLRYLRDANNFRINDFSENNTKKINNIATSNIRYTNIFLLPTSDNIINEFEDSDIITTNFLSFEKTFNFVTVGGGNIDTTQLTVPSSKGFVWNTSTPIDIGYSNIEPTPILENKMGIGVLEIEEIGNDFFRFENESGDYDFWFDVYSYQTILIIGKDYNNPRIAYQGTLNVRPITFNQVVNQSGTGNFSFEIGNGIPNNNLPKMSIELKEGEKVWHQYSITVQGLPFFIYYFLQFNYTNLKFSNNKILKAEFKAKSHPLNSITDVNDVTHYNIKMFEANQKASTIFNATDEFFNISEFNDIYFTTGEQVRNKLQQRPIKLKPKQFFESIEAFLPIGLGLDYNNATTSYKLFLKEHKEFYQDAIYQVYDLIDEVDLSVGTISYNDIEIGSEQFKETSLSKHKRNNYNVQTSKYRSKWSKITKFILDPYIWLRAIKSGTDIDKKEFDDNFFIMSAKNLSGKIISLSNTSGFANDNVTELNSISVWLNRRYSTVYNLFRKVNQWRESIFYDKPELYNNSIYNNELSITGSSYLDNVQTPQDMSLVRSVIENHNPNRKFENTIIKFNTPMNESEFFELTKHWYEIIGANDGNVIHYGNIISCELSEGVAQFQLIKRIL